MCSQRMGGGQISLKISEPPFNKDLSNETTFSLIYCISQDSTVPLNKNANIKTMALSRLEVLGRNVYPKHKSGSSTLPLLHQKWAEITTCPPSHLRSLLFSDLELAVKNIKTTTSYLSFTVLPLVALLGKNHRLLVKIFFFLVAQ
jgi:hypothetical protein